MKKLVALLLAAMMLLSVSALAEAPEGYPEVVPGIDFGGKTLYIYAWYDSKRADEPTEEEQARYDYEDWIMDTYNVKIEFVNKYDWAGGIADLGAFVGNPDPSILCLYTLPGDFVGTALRSDFFVPIDEYIDFDDEKWNQLTRQFMTKGGRVYGMLNGATEPREGIYFNKRILEDAGIEWDTIYDMQAEGTWTFEAFENMLAQVQKDVDNDGVIDIWGMTGDRDSFIFGAVYSNNGAIFASDENGKISVAAGSDQALEALNWVSNIYATYFYKGEPDENGSVAWDYYKEAWKQGISGFRSGQTWEGFNDYTEMDGMEDEWGFVAIPLGPQGTTYVNLANDNTVGVPAVGYDAETVKKICFIYDLWTNPTPGTEEDELAWVGNKYNKTDERAVDETYAMLRQPEHVRINPQLALGDKNELLGNSLLWQIGYGTPAELVEAATPAWQAVCDQYNAKADANAN